ncbi:hypothetical protein H0H87_002817 [Tephrocybe sp. NHM501043]|nr:hypothetical protein H0H87_002817 [Tephrocybe sp. NHM501043]
MVGTIQQKLYIRGVPSGLSFRVTALNLLPPTPAKEWRATLYDSSERQRIAPFVVNPNVNSGYMGVVKLYGAHAFPTSVYLPFSLHKSSGLTQFFYSSNSAGARLEILWELTSSTTREPGDPDPDENDGQPEHEHPPEKPDDEQDKPTIDPKDPSNWPTDPLTLTIDGRDGVARAGTATRNGRLIVETTWWGLIQRPDYVSVLYQVGAETPLRIESKVAATIISQPKDALFIVGVNKEDEKIAINATQDTDVSNTIASAALKGIFYIHEKAFGWVFGKFLPF